MVMAICASRSPAFRMHAVSCETRARSEEQLPDGIYPSAIAHRLRPISSMARLLRFAPLHLGATPDTGFGFGAGRHWPLLREHFVAPGVSLSQRVDFSTFEPPVCQ